MKAQNRFHLDGLIDGFVQITVIDDGFRHQFKITPRKMLGIVAQLAKVDDKQVCMVLLPVHDSSTSFKISRAEAKQLAAEINQLFKWKQ